MLRHRRQRWAAMDFLLVSYRKQKKWIVLRQVLLLLSRLALAALLIAMLAGWSGGRQWFNMLGGSVTHHIVVLDDSYSMGDSSGGSTSYEVALQTLSDLTRQMASEDGDHQLTLVRASRAVLASRADNKSGDAAADLSAQTIDVEGRLIDRIIASTPSPMRTDVSQAVEMAVDLVEASSADEQFLYVLSDFRQRDWDQPDRVAELLEGLGDQTKVQLVDCGASPQSNLAITGLAPQPDVWVAGVPVVMDVSVKNHSANPATNVAMTVRLVLYGDDVTAIDSSRTESGEVEALPAIVIDSLAPGAEVTKSFQVFIPKSGTHAIQVALPDDALAIDNRRTCTLPLTDTEKVLVIDDDPDGRGAYHIASVLDPGSQVRIGAIPEVQTSAYLRGLSFEAMAGYRSIYIVDIPAINESVAEALDDYVRRGGGLGWFLGAKVDRASYNQTLVSGTRFLLPRPLAEVTPLQTRSSTAQALQMSPNTLLMKPLQSAGNGVFSLVGLTKSWTWEDLDDDADGAPAPRLMTDVQRSDGEPFVTRHDYGNGRIITVGAGLNGEWTNWPGDPTFVVFLLQTNANLWSAASPSTSRLVEQAVRQPMSADTYSENTVWLPPANEAPRLPIEFSVDTFASDDSNDSGGTRTLVIAPESVLSGENLDLDDILRPGLGELVMTQMDGQIDVLPVASNIAAGESDLARVNRVELVRRLQPTEASFVDAGQWSEGVRQAGTSTLTLVLLGLLALLFAVEQALAYWASYHPSGKSTGKSAGHAVNASTGTTASVMGGRQ